MRRTWPARLSISRHSWRNHCPASALLLFGDALRPSLPTKQYSLQEPTEYIVVAVAVAIAVVAYTPSHQSEQDSDCSALNNHGVCMLLRCQLKASSTRQIPWPISIPFLLYFPSFLSWQSGDDRRDLISKSLAFSLSCSAVQPHHANPDL